MIGTAPQDPRRPVEDDEPDAPPLPTRSRWRIALAWLPGLAVLAGLVWLVRTRSGEEREIADLFRRVRPSWLLLAVLLQLFTYFSVGEAWRIPLARGGFALRRSTLARLAMLKLTLDQAIPTGGVSGTAYMIRSLRRRRVAPEVLGATLLVVLAGYYLAYAIGVLVALVVLWMHDCLNAWVAAAGVLFAVTAALLPPALVLLLRKAPERIPERLRRLPGLRELGPGAEVIAKDLAGDWRLQLAATAGSFTTMLLDGATLEVAAVALGARPSFGSCFAALVAGSVAATIGVMPGGLGTFESASVAVLTLTGTDAATALAATLLLRAFTFWLPMIPGALLLRPLHPPGRG